MLAIQWVGCYPGTTLCRLFVFSRTITVRKMSLKMIGTKTFWQVEVPKVPKKNIVGISVLNLKVRTVLRYFGTGKMLNKASKFVEISSADITTAAN